MPAEVILDMPDLTVDPVISIILDKDNPFTRLAFDSIAQAELVAHGILLAVARVDKAFGLQDRVVVLDEDFPEAPGWDF